MILLRILRRKTSLELKTPEEFVTAELLRDGQPDLDLSVYEIEDNDDHVIRTHAEHAVSFIDPPSHRLAGGGATLNGCAGDLEETQGDSLFKFTREQHRELKFFHDQELLVAARLVLAEADRRRLVEKERMLAFVRARLEASDAEWKAACERRPKWHAEALKKPKPPPPSTPPAAAPPKS